jgi:hypothetical protein
MKPTRLLVSLVTVLAVSFLAFAADTSLRRIRAAITSMFGSMVPPWAAHEAGICKKYGLQVEIC